MDRNIRNWNNRRAGLLTAVTVVAWLVASPVSLSAAEGLPSGEAPGEALHVAGDSALDASFARRSRITRAGMGVLGGWALANLAVGTPLALQLSGEEGAFWEANAVWNTVNLSLALVGGARAGLFGERLAAAPPPDLAAEIRAQHALEKTLLFNAGIDLGYVMAGVWLVERGRADRSLGSAGPERLAGWGEALILQGAFLFAFDVILAAIQARERPYEAAIPRR